MATSAKKFVKASSTSFCVVLITIEITSLTACVQGKTLSRQLMLVGGLLGLHLHNFLQMTFSAHWSINFETSGWYLHWKWEKHDIYISWKQGIDELENFVWHLNGLDELENNFVAFLDAGITRREIGW